jgi:hypothetical protein
MVLLGISFSHPCESDFFLVGVEQKPHSVIVSPLYVTESNILNSRSGHTVVCATKCAQHEHVL